GIADEANTGTGRAVYRVGDLGRVPAVAVDPRFTIVAERNVQAEQTWVSPRGDDATVRILDVDETITGDTGRRQRRFREPLAGHRLHGIAPELRHLHAR